MIEELTKFILAKSAEAGIEMVHIPERNLYISRKALEIENSLPGTNPGAAEPTREGE